MPISGLKDEDFQKINIESKDQKDQPIKNRMFDLNKNQYDDVLGKYTNTKYAIFFDMIETSMLDILIVSNSNIEMTNSKKSIPYISAIYNNLNEDMFYIKARMLSDNKIGVPIREASFRMVVTDLSDEKFVV